MAPRLPALLLAVLGAVLGIAVSFAIMGAPKMLESQPISGVLIAGLKVVGLFALLYIPGTLLYGTLLLWGTALLGSRSLVVFMLLGLLPAFIYAGYALTQYGTASGWEGALLFHGIPCLVASIILWLSSGPAVT